MPERPPGEVLASIDERLNNLASDIAEIKVQTTLTNGRVSALETARAVAEGIRLDRAQRLASEHDAEQAATETLHARLARRVTLQAAGVAGLLSIAGSLITLAATGHL